jgi:predicted DNA-binding protein
MPKGKIRRSTSIRLPNDIICKLGIISEHKGIAISKYVTKLIKNKVESEYSEAVKALASSIREGR